MAKVIKFNLIIDRQPVRDLDDLSDNFNVDDVLAAFNNGSLQRWLEVRGLQDELAKVAKLAGETTVVVCELCKIFRANCTKDEAATAAYIFDLRLNEEKRLAQYQSLANKRDEIVSLYHKEYNNLLADMETKHEDYPSHKAAVQKISQKYLGLFKLNAVDFYNRFILDVLLAILAVLAHSDMRRILTSVIDANLIFECLTNSSYAIKSWQKRFALKETVPLLKTCLNDEDLAALKERRRTVFVLSISTDSESYSSSGKAMKFFNTDSLKPPFQYIDRERFLPPSVKVCFEATDGHFAHLELQGRRFMIIKMEEDNIVMKRDGLKENELKAEDVNGKFVILDGLDYYGKNDNDRLVYMEV